MARHDRSPFSAQDTLHETNDPHAQPARRCRHAYSFTPNFSLEAGYADLGRIKSDAGRLRADGWFLDAVGTLALGNDFSLLGRVGVFDGKLRRDLNGSQLDGSVSASERGTSYKLGAGLQYDFNKSTALRAEWEHYRFDALDSTPHANLLSVGVNYKF